jgi:hypothetical protein
MSPEVPQLSDHERALVAEVVRRALWALINLPITSNWSPSR